MWPWILLAVVLSVVGGVLTLVWWRVGDQWADEEHRRFHAGSSESQAAQVVKDFSKVDTPPPPTT
jgi:hypothetical protein